MDEWLKCDQCAAQAMWEAKRDEMSLYFCGHHKNSQGEPLADWAHEMIQLLTNEKQLQLETAE